MARGGEESIGTQRLSFSESRNLRAKEGARTFLLGYPRVFPRQTPPARRRVHQLI